MDAMMTEETVGMDDALYSAPEGDKEEATKDEAASIDDQNEENPTALIPLSALGKNVKEGDSITLKVSKIDGEEAIVSLSSGDKKANKEQSSDDELDSMSETTKEY